MADNDYIRQCARLFKETLRSESKIYIEYSNEVWNTQFAQTQYAEQQGVRLGFTPTDRPWEGKAPFYVRRSMEIFKIFEEEFGDADRFVRVLAWQTGSSVDNMMNYEYHVINGEGMPSLEGKKGSDLADAFATAPYFGGYLGGRLEWVNSHTVEDILVACENHLQEVMNTVDKQVKDAARFGKIFLAYEAGQHLAGTGGNENNQDMTDKFIAANRHPRMKELYLNYLERWKMSGAQTMCIFSSIGTPSKWGSWSVLEDYCKTVENSPKYAAIREFSEANTPAWWLLPPPDPEPTGDLLVNFDASALTTNLPLLRGYQDVNGKDMVPFDTSNNGKLFDGGSNTQATIYGGFVHVDPNNPSRKPNLERNKGFTIYMDAQQQYSEGTGLFIWRKDQFLQQGDQIVDKLSVQITSYVGKARFVVKNNGKYYLSEYLMSTTGVFELTGCSNSSLPTKRWFEFDPTVPGNTFSIPELMTGFKAVELNNVTEVGLWITSNRPQWGHTLAVYSFKAYARYVPPAPGNHSALTSLISECNTLLSDVVSGELIGDGNGQYPSVSKTTFENAISIAQQTDDNTTASQLSIDGAVSALNEAKEVFLASMVTVDYTPLGDAITGAEELYDTTEEGTGIGQYPLQARTDFSDAIETAKDAYTAQHLTTVQVAEAVSVLTAAMQVYRDSEITEISVDIDASLPAISIYPNPVKELLYIDAGEVAELVKVYSPGGVLLYEARSVKSLDLSSLPQGFYLLHVSTGNENTVIGFVKE